MEEDNLATLCLREQWEEATSLIIRDPSSVWRSRDRRGNTAIYWICYKAQTDILSLIITIIQRFPVQNKELIYNSLEEPCSSDERRPAHAAARGAFWGTEDCLKILINNSPSGPAILEMKTVHGNTPAHTAASSVNYTVEILDIIIRNAPSGIGILKMKNNYGETPLDIASPEIRKHFTPQKIKEIGLELELQLLQKNYQSEQDSLAALMFGVLMEETELQKRRSIRNSN